MPTIIASEPEELRVNGVQYLWGYGEKVETNDPDLVAAAYSSPYLSVIAVDPSPAPIAVEESDVIDLRSVIVGQLGDLLFDEGYDTVADVQDASDDELLSIQGVGPAALRRIRDALAML